MLLADGRGNCLQYTSNDTPGYDAYEPEAAVTLAGFVALYCRKPLRGCGTTETPGDYWGDDKQDDGRNDWPVVAVFAAVPEIPKDSESTQEAEGVA